MALLTVKLRTVSPLFLGGANPRGQPELRSASVRGQLRYWLRAVLGAYNPDLSEVWKDEEQIFGSTEVGSAISVRIHRPAHIDSDKKYPKYPMLPHKHSEQEQVRTPAIPPKTTLSLQLATRPRIELPQDAQNAMIVWSLLGGLGKRSRRMFGAFDARIWGKDKPETPNELIHLSQEVLAGICKYQTDIYPQIPNFPTLNYFHSRVVIGRSGTDDPMSLIESLFTNLLRTSRYASHEDMFGYVGKDRYERQNGRKAKVEEQEKRRASPLIAQMRLIGNKHYPIFTVMRSRMKQKAKNQIGSEEWESREVPHEQWAILDNFMDDAEEMFNGATVWGGRLVR